MVLSSFELSSDFILELWGSILDFEFNFFIIVERRKLSVWNYGEEGVLNKGKIFSLFSGCAFLVSLVWVFFIF